MNTSSSDPTYFRNKGLEFLQKGKEYFNSHTEFEYREKGYQLYKKGLDYLVKYAKCISYSIFASHLFSRN